MVFVCYRTKRLTKGVMEELLNLLDYNPINP
jgi:hypothetical protein